ncbi:MAG: peptide MFS transporter [Flavobacteriaceae bacterium]|nr:peptide MFS transporter [Flavobacteriaceae bacterium]
MSDYAQESSQQQILGHPIGLFVLFFTEMWERFSYYGMRALLILFLVAKISDDGWGWSRSEAYALYGWYVMLVYFMPLLGGWLADNKWGHVKTVIIGAAIITLGHASMAVSDLQIGVDLKFVFYLGLFLIILGTGLFKPNMSSIVGKMYSPQSKKKDGAYTIFYMGVNSGAFIGTLLVGWIGETFSWTWGFGLAGIFMLFGLLQFYYAREVFGKAASEPKPKEENLTKEEKEQDVPFTKIDLTIASIGGFFAISWIIDGLYSVVTRGKHFLTENLFSFDAFGSLISVDMSTFFFLLSLVFFIIAFFVIFFWASFEQAGTTMNIFAKDYTNRTLVGNWGLFYKIIDFILSIAPMLVLTWVIYKLGKAIIKKYPLTILFTSISFTIIWILVIYRVYDKLTGNSALVDTSWFQILNPVFIISLAPLYSKFWEKYKFSGPQKFFGGLTLLAAGFGVLAIGASSIPPGAETAAVSMIWLILAYFLHTMGELAISPVGLSYVSKLAPARMLGFLFGIWYVFTGLAGKLASIMAEYSDGIAKNVGFSGFFLIFTIIPFVAGLVMLSLNKPIKRMMHGIDK